MADTKITALAAIGANPINVATFPIPMVDLLDNSMAASGTTKKVTVNQILGAGGTATLASATISGDLTVDTNTLKVDSVNHRVGIGLVIPNRNLSIFGSSNSLIHFTTTATGPNNTDGFTFGVETDSSVTLFNAENTPFNFYVNGTTAMTLNSTGLGVGVTPSAWATGTYKSLQIGQSSSISAGVASELVVVGSNCYFDTTDSRWERITSGYTSQYYQTGGTHVWRIGGTAGANTDCSFTQAMTLDASGNLLVGTTDAGSNSGIGLKAAYSATAPYFATVGSSTSASEYSYLLYSTGGTPAFKFYVSYSGQISSTSGTVAALSDARFKENIQDIDVGLGAILALKPRKFDWKAGRGKDIKGDRGFIAQELEEVFPNLIDEWADPAPEGEAPYKSVRQDLIPVLVKAIQELAAEVNALKNA